MTHHETFPAERTAVLTGAASPRGIGRATAEMLASAGWSVAIGTLTDERKAAMSADILVGRVGTVRDIAALMVFLMGENAGYITAATYDINGGLQIS